MRLPFKIRMDVTGEADLVEVNGVDVTGKVDRVSVDTVEGLKVYLEVAAGGTIEGEGIITVNVPANAGADIATWIRQLNPAAIVEAVMKCEDDFDKSPIEQTLEVLAKLAESNG